MPDVLASHLDKLLLAYFTLSSEAGRLHLTLLGIKISESPAEQKEALPERDVLRALAEADAALASLRDVSERLDLFLIPREPGDDECEGGV